MQCIALPPGGISNFFVFLVGFPGNIIYRFLKCQFYFSYIFVKIANIRKYRQNDDYFPMVNSVKCVQFWHGLEFRGCLTWWLDDFALISAVAKLQKLLHYTIIIEKKWIVKPDNYYKLDSDNIYYQYNHVFYQ